MKENRSLFQIVDQVIKSFGNRSNLANVRFQNCVPDQVGNVNGNADLIIFLLVLLVENALNFVAQKGRVEIGANVSSRDFKMWVRNDGKGIPKESRELIFERQFQADNQQSQTYMGLSIVKRILNYYGGQIWVESDRRRGNIFVFTVPNQD